MNRSFCHLFPELGLDIWVPRQFLQGARHGRACRIRTCKNDNVHLAEKLFLRKLVL
jgi:hypothetical protein